MKNKKFTLEPDGFSIHTLELRQKLSKKEFNSLKEELYDISPYGMMFEEKTGLHLCTRYAKKGIRIRLEHYNKDSIHQYFLRLIVNPRKLIDPTSSYLGIFPPEKGSIYELEMSFNELFRDSPLPSNINNYDLSRLDLCTNFRCEDSAIFQEMVRVLAKLPTPLKYKRIKHKEKDKKKEKLYNKHYIQFSCGTHDLVIYDKTYQMASQHLATDEDNLDHGVLRFEVQCNNTYLLDYGKEHPYGCTIELIWHMTQNSRKQIIKHFKHCFGTITFYHLERKLTSFYLH